MAVESPGASHLPEVEVQSDPEVLEDLSAVSVLRDQRRLPEVEVSAQASVGRCLVSGVPRLTLVQFPVAEVLASAFPVLALTSTQLFRTATLAALTLVSFDTVAVKHKNHLKPINKM